MKLLTKAIRKRLPALYSQDGKGKNAVIWVKFFCPWNNWTWYVIEGEPVINDAGHEVDFIFFGWVDGVFSEYGYFRLSELENVKGPVGLKIERDRYWQPRELWEVMYEKKKKN